jgi:predicted aminopeptidase
LSFVRTLAAALLLPALSGCYLVTQAAGQISMLASMRDVGDVRADPATSDRARSALALIAEIRSFGVEVMGLRAGSSYTHFFDTRGTPVTHVVSACRKDRFEPKTWWFPFVGTVPYKGFFDRADADAEADALRAEGLDVHVGAAAAYSTLGWFPDPILSTMLDLPEEELANLILHELTHNTVWIPGDVDLNEGLASFVGGQGALEFVRRRHGTGSPAYERAVRMLAAEERRDARGRKLYEALKELYASDVSRAAKLRERERIRAGWARAEGEERRKLLDRALAFEAEELPPPGVPCALVALLAAPARSAEAAAYRRRAEAHRVPEGPVNNAVLLQWRRYGRGDEFREAFEAAGGDWGRFFEAMRKRATS